MYQVSGGPDGFGDFTPSPSQQTKQRVRGGSHLRIAAEVTAPVVKQIWLHHPIAIGKRWENAGCMGFYGIYPLVNLCSLLWKQWFKTT